MVLVAPLRLARPAPPSPVPVEGGTGREVLARLRGDTSARPRFDPALAGGLRAWLEDAAYDVVARRGEHAPPLVLGPRQALGGTDAPGFATTSDEVVLARLVRALFRQLVHTGALGDPLGDALGDSLGDALGDPFGDALDALRVGGGAETVAQIEAAEPAARAALADTLARHATNLRAVVPRFAPGWLPRTDDRVAIPLAGGRVVLRGVFDLLVGIPQPDVASLCALALSTGGTWVRARRSLHYLALLETLRSGTPPFRLALLESASGRYGVEDVREEHLRALASHLAFVLAGAGVPTDAAGSDTPTSSRG